MTKDQIKKDRDTSLDDITLDYKSLEFHFPYEMALDEQKSVNQSWQNLGNDIAQHLESRYFNWGCSSRSVDGINDAPHFSILVEVIENS